MKKSPKSRAWQAAMFILLCGALALIPFEHGGANGRAMDFLSKAHNLTSDSTPPNTSFTNLFIALDSFRSITYYDQTDLLDLL